MGGKLPWGGTGIYIQSYTFYGDMPCKPDSAAASKGFKGKGKDWEVGRLPRALKGREFKTTTLCKYTSMYICYNPGGLNIYYTRNSTTCQVISELSLFI